MSAPIGHRRKIPRNSSLLFDGVIPFSYSPKAYHIDLSNNDFVTLPMFSTTFLELPEWFSSSEPW